MTNESSRSADDPSRRQTWEVVFDPQFVEDPIYWIATDRRTALRLADFIRVIARDPLEGIGRPEPLRYLGPDVWSRRLTQEHRIVYRVDAGRIYFLQARHHY